MSPGNRFFDKVIPKVLEYMKARHEMNKDDKCKECNGTTVSIFTDKPCTSCDATGRHPMSAANNKLPDPPEMTEERLQQLDREERIASRQISNPVPPLEQRVHELERMTEVQDAAILMLQARILKLERKTTDE